VSWNLSRLAGFDLETTGVDPEADRIVSACVVQVGGNHPTESRTWLADPGVPIPDGAARVHGITTAKARDEGRPAVEVVEQLVAALAEVVAADVPLVIMNAPFDLTMLDREARRHGVIPLTDIVGDGLRVIDPKVIDKQMSKRAGKRTLTDLCTHYEVRLDGAHTADADAIAACRVAWRLGQRYPQIGGRTVAELHTAQIEWAASQARSLRAYFARTAGKGSWAEGVRPDWPMVPFAVAEGVSS
jgi:DNA polymerase-3 subunit epsilon